MILVTRLNGVSFYINPELIRYIEETPDTVITMQDNVKLIVRDRAETVVERFVDYQRRVRQTVLLGNDAD